ncbi:hypothetical protein NL676_023309 [Syzygium grande]|nr:hypothetical protein NL676_023309 [Syzygium grande]
MVIASIARPSRATPSSPSSLVAMGEPSLPTLVWKFADSSSGLAESPEQSSKLTHPSRALFVITYGHGQLAIWKLESQIWKAQLQSWTSDSSKLSHSSIV